MSLFSKFALVLLTTSQMASGQTLRGQVAELPTGTASANQRLEHVMGLLMEESVLADNSNDVMKKANSLAVEQQYEFLLNWVLPSKSHDSIRITAHFASDDTLHAQRHATDNLVSPALELIAVAKQLGRLSELRQRFSVIQADSEQQHRARLAILTLVDISGNDFDAALESMHDLYERHRNHVFGDLQDRWPETLVAAEAVHHAQLREPTEEILLRMLQQQVRSGKNNGPDPWDRLIPSLLGRMTLYKAPLEQRAKFGDAPPLQDWFPVSASDFGTHGLGFPTAHWEWDGKSVRLLSHHQNDYLYFRSPLSGCYEVECDSTGFDYREAQLMAAGTWVVPAFNHQEYFAGRVGNHLPLGKITPRLSEITDWMRLQARVTEKQCSFFINGRLVHEETLSKDHDPWLAIRVPFSTYGRVRDLCITGNPAIPDTLRLSANHQLHGWTSYYGGGIGDRRYHDWWHETDESGIGMIVGINTESRAGTAKESLLQYQRPVIEDGEIEFDFFFDPGKSHVHPAVGRDVMLLQPQGVTIHQITDAHFDCTGADPLNQRSPVTTDADVEVPQLNAGEWNHAELRFRDDGLELFVNGRLVYRGKTAARRNDRVFGLFHYDGDTEIRVRNVEWRGDWPKTLPALNEQELRDKTTDELDESLPELTAEFSHDFAENGLPLSLFQIQDQGADQYVQAKADGLHVNAEMNGSGYSRVCVTPLLIIEGDFDMTTTFESLKIAPTGHGLCNAILQMALTDEPISHHSASMATIVDPGKFPQRVVDHDLLQLKPFHMGLLDKRSEEVTSGTLRLARRADKMYSLLAPEDSKIFRVIHVENTATQPSRFDGARLVTGMNSSVDGISRVSIIWKNLHIRAHRLSGPAMEH